MPVTPSRKKLLDQVRDMLRLKHYSRRTEESYVNWIRRYILFHEKKHPKDVGAEMIYMHVPPTVWGLWVNRGGLAVRSPLD
jgi:hypothetical protein